MAAGGKYSDVFALVVRGGQIPEVRPCHLKCLLG